MLLPAKIELQPPGVPHLDGLLALEPLLVVLVAEDEEGTAVLVKGQAAKGLGGHLGRVVRFENSTISYACALLIKPQRREKCFFSSRILIVARWRGRKIGPGCSILSFACPIF